MLAVIIIKYGLHHTWVTRKYISSAHPYLGYLKSYSYFFAENRVV